jgi:hypothetical protein
MFGNVCCYCKPNHSANYRQFIFLAAYFAVFWRDFGILVIARSEISETEKRIGVEHPLLF